jgi:hypothetical protein
MDIAETLVKLDTERRQIKNKKQNSKQQKIKTETAYPLSTCFTPGFFGGVLVAHCFSF